MRLEKTARFEEKHLCVCTRLWGPQPLEILVFSCSVPLLKCPVFACEWAHLGRRMWWPEVGTGYPSQLLLHLIFWPAPSGALPISTSHGNLGYLLQCQLCGCWGANSGLPTCVLCSETFTDRAILPAHDTFWMTGVSCLVLDRGYIYSYQKTLW